MQCEWLHLPEVDQNVQTVPATMTEGFAVSECILFLTANIVLPHIIRVFLGSILLLHSHFLLIWLKDLELPLSFPPRNNSD